MQCGGFSCVAPVNLLLFYHSLGSPHGPKGETSDVESMSHDDDTIDFLETRKMRWGCPSDPFIAPFFLLWTESDNTWLTSVNTAGFQQRSSSWRQALPPAGSQLRFGKADTKAGTLCFFFWESNWSTLCSFILSLPGYGLLMSKISVSFQSLTCHHSLLLIWITITKADGTHGWVSREGTDVNVWALHQSHACC